MTTAPTPTSGAADLRTAAQAVVDRWDTPLWKDVPATAEYIGRLRAALAAAQATAAQAGEYPALVCDYCGAHTPDPWHSSGMLHGKMSKHIHSCDACAARGAAQAQAGAVQLTCEWTHNEDDGFWETACGEAWRFDDGGPGENNMHFCHSCGNSLRIKGGQHGTE